MLAEARRASISSCEKWEPGAKENQSSRNKINQLINQKKKKKWKSNRRGMLEAQIFKVKSLEALLRFKCHEAGN